MFTSARLTDTALEATHGVSVIAPVKDELDSIAELVAQLSTALDALPSSAGAPGDWEVIFVDDGSTDGTWQEIVRIAALEPRVRGVNLRRNFGKSLALRAGLDIAHGAIIVMIDGDLQDDPAEIPAMVARLEDGADVVAGHKAHRKDPLGKRLPSKFFNWTTGAVTGLHLRDHNCGLKVFRREAIESLPLYGEMHRFIAAIAYAQGYSVVEQSVNHRPRVHGRSKFGFERYVRGALDLLTVVTLTRFYRRPAHLFGGVGMALGAVGMVILTYLSVMWAFFGESIGSRPLLLLGVLLVLVSIQLIGVGLIAELLVSRDARDEHSFRGVRTYVGVKP